ncbi:hypothetical protein E2P81_ATG09673 [Venturia nashicola]|nr:hypothetical protein E2P81_ATG09673 [Venturia nashicola]
MVDSENLKLGRLKIRLNVALLLHQHHDSQTDSRALSRPPIPVNDPLLLEATAPTPSTTLKYVPDAPPAVFWRAANGPASTRHTLRTARRPQEPLPRNVPHLYERSPRSILAPSVVVVAVSRALVANNAKCS